MKQKQLPEHADATSPAGAAIRFLMHGLTGNMIHATVPAGQINRATVHASVNEFWYILSGAGEIWRRDGESEAVIPLHAGVSLDIPVGTAFQYRCLGPQPLTFICVTMPPWPGDHEATPVQGPWTATA
jgi:mannose-6-phosphate isomerase-like protein (cupin superfamily)